MNKIFIEKPEVVNNRIKYNYKIEGEWVKYFNDEEFYIEYQENIENVPESVLVIPFICNIIPIAWLCDGTIYADELDESFYTQIDNIKKGYSEMYSDLTFKGNIITKPVKNNLLAKKYQSAAMFSGGVDAFYTYLKHIDEKPLLISIWGADIKPDNNDGWSNVKNHLESINNEFGDDVSIVKSNFRTCTNTSELNKIIQPKYEWWHDMQHGIAIISHASPLAYLYGFKNLYIASSFTSEQKGSYVCASDPTIDNYVHFVDSKTIHDGYDANRTEKVKYICQFSKSNNKKIEPRVCWISDGGTNCCKCEKCYRTIYAIISCGNNPNNFGLKWNLEDNKKVKYLFLNTNKIKLTDKNLLTRYQPISYEFLKNKHSIKNYEEYLWIAEMDWKKFNNLPIKVVKRNLSKVIQLPKRVLKKIYKIIKCRCKYEC